MENDQKFQGGGTPIGSIIQEQAPQHRLPEQQIPPQIQNHQAPPHQLSEQHRLLEQQQQMQHYMQNQQQPPQQRQSQVQYRQPVVQKTNQFEETMGMTILQFIILIILISVVNSPFVIGIEKKLLPINLRMGDPPFLIIIINAIIITLVYVGINKLQDKLKN